MKIAALIWCSVALYCVPLSAKSPFALLERGGELEIRFNERKVLVYAFETNQFKPYIRELYSLRGENVLLDAPKDHIHHHGLMYAVAVNGINFWEEQTDPGVQKSIKFLSRKTGRSREGVPQASFTQLIHWVARTNRSLADTERVALLIEKRTLCLAVDESLQEVAVEWTSDFKVGPKVQKAVLTGSSYFGLGMRFPRAFDHVCKFGNAENKPYPGEKPGDVIQAAWTSVRAKLDGQEVTLAVFGSPDNKAGAPWFYSMVDNFAYLTATQHLYKNPIEYGAKESFKVSYLVTVYPRATTADFLNQRFERWEKEKR